MKTNFNEPWHTNHLPTDIWSAAGAHICDTAAIHAPEYFHDYKAIAARIVACVNACAGISNIDLANGVTPNKPYNSFAAICFNSYYNIDVWAERGETWLACSQMYLHDLCCAQEVSHA